MVLHGCRRAYFKNRLPEGLDILYMYRYVSNSILALNAEPEYQGVYKRDTKELYDAGFETSEILKETDVVMHGSANIIDDIEERVRTLVEKMVGKYSDSITNEKLNEEVKKTLRDQAWETAKKRYLEDVTVIDEYQCDYNEDEYHKHLADIILKKDEYVKNTAEQYHNSHIDEIREDIIRNRYIREELQNFNNGENEHYTAVKRIIQAVPKECKTVNVTVRIGEEEFTFKYEARFLRYDCPNTYSTWNIPATSRWEFEERFGKRADFGPKDITKITYGRKELYVRE